MVLGSRGPKQSKFVLFERPNMAKTVMFAPGGPKCPKTLAYQAIVPWKFQEQHFVWTACVVYIKKNKVYIISFQFSRSSLSLSHWLFILRLYWCQVDDADGDVSLTTVCKRLDDILAGLPFMTLLLFHGYCHKSIILVRTSSIVNASLERHEVRSGVAQEITFLSWSSIFFAAARASSTRLKTHFVNLLENFKT